MHYSIAIEEETRNWSMELYGNHGNLIHIGAKWKHFSVCAMPYKLVHSQYDIRHKCGCRLSLSLSVYALCAPHKYWFHWFKFQFRLRIIQHQRSCERTDSRCSLQFHSHSVLLLFVVFWPLANSSKNAVIILKWTLADSSILVFSLFFIGKKKPAKYLVFKVSERV